MRKFLHWLKTTLDSNVFFLFICLFVIFSLGLVGGMNSSDGANYALTKSLVEKRTIYLHEYATFTYFIDYAISPKNKLYLSDREPGISILSAPFYLFGKYASPYTFAPFGIMDTTVNNESKLQMWTYSFVPFFVAFSLLILYLLLKAWCKNEYVAILTVLSIAFCTLMWKYSSSYSRHPVVAMCVAVSCLATILYYTKHEKRYIYLVLSGLFLGIASTVDYLSWIPSFLLFVLIVAFGRRPKEICIFLISFLPLLSVALIYNTLAFGNPFSSPHDHEGYFTYMNDFSNNFRTPIYWGAVLNLFSFQTIPAQAIHWVLNQPTINAQIGAQHALSETYKGIFIQSPVLFFAVYGWIKYCRELPRKLMFVILIPIVLFSSFFIPMSMFTQFWSPNIYDSRHMLAVVPLLLLGLRDVREICKMNRFLPFLLLFLFIVSFYFAFESMITNFAPNISGENRYTIAGIGEDIRNTKNYVLVLIKIFPNIINFYQLLAVGTLLYFTLVLPILTFLEKKIQD